ncbi:hypothetical protein NIASO_11500 [Niabella soli DSM 19437]|uniref:Uncharacterized protein n=1 Tax=Niabella soli DSM 19437 TaxID=929713 RepID=W0F3P2_9BACT|nr:hypothetical protein NIASO_11500 [Niabella soli DSM 19437]
MNVCPINNFRYPADSSRFFSLMFADLVFSAAHLRYLREL